MTSISNVDTPLPWETDIHPSTRQPQISRYNTVLNMLRRSLIVLAKNAEKRTIVRDPRKRAVAAVPTEPSEIQPQQQQQPTRTPMPFEPTQQNQQSVGSTLGSYALMGAGVALGFALIGALFG